MNTLCYTAELAASQDVSTTLFNAGGTKGEGGRSFQSFRALHCLPQLSQPIGCVFPKGFTKSFPFAAFQGQYLVAEHLR